MSLIENEIDLVKLDKELNRHYFNCYIRDHYYAQLRSGFDASLFLVNSALCLDKNIRAEYSPLIQLVGIGAIVGLLVENAKLSEIKKRISLGVMQEIKDFIMNSVDYRILEEKYYDYICDLARFMQTQGISDGPGVAYLYQFMLDKGYLSYSKEHKYNQSLINKKNRKNSHKYEIEDLWGCRVATGASVCRHMSSLLVDLENAIGNHAHNVSVYTVYNDMSIREYADYIANHCISVIHDKDNNIFGYCPTNNLTLELKSLYAEAIDHTHTYLQCKPILCSVPGDDMYIAKDTENYADYNRKDLEKIINLDGLSNYDIDLLNKRKEEITNFINSKQGVNEINNFYCESSQKLKELKDRIEYLMPITDKKVKKLIIR